MNVRVAVAIVFLDICTATFKNGNENGGSTMACVRRNGHICAGNMHFFDGVRGEVHLLEAAAFPGSSCRQLLRIVDHFVWR